MGDWQYGYDRGLWGMDGVPYQNTSHEDYDYPTECDEGGGEILSIYEWNQRRRSIKPGSKAKYVIGSTAYFSFRQTRESLNSLKESNQPQVYETFMGWKNKGRVVISGSKACYKENGVSYFSYSQTKKI